MINIKCYKNKITNKDIYNITWWYKTYTTRSIATCEITVILLLSKKLWNEAKASQEVFGVNRIERVLEDSSVTSTRVSPINKITINAQVGKGKPNRGDTVTGTVWSWGSVSTDGRAIIPMF